jgi:imidazolonepropionase-like amidohydrolase
MEKQMHNLAFTNGNLFDGKIESDLHKDVTILVEVEPRGKLVAGVITQIGPVDEVPIPSDFRVIDFGGKFIIPGLINAHCHLFGDGTPRALASAPESILQLFVKIMNSPLGRRYMKSSMRTNAKTALNAGVTTLRTVGDFNYYDVQIRDEIESGMFLGSRLLVSGKGICVTGGHGWFVSYISDNPWEARKAVRKILRHGADLVKILSTGGVMDSKRLGEAGRPQMTVEEIAAACDEAHRAGYKVATHCESTLGIREALLGGVDSIEHGAPIPEDLIPLFKHNPKALNGYTTLVSTVSAGLDLCELGMDVLKIPRVVQENAKIIRDGMISGMKTAIKNEIPVGMGTDASVPFVPHYEFWRELVCYQHFGGITPKRAINIATEQNAILLGIEDITGTVEVGKSADFIVLDENPLEDLMALENLRHVVIRGNLIEKPIYKKVKAIEAHKANRYFEKYIQNGVNK